MSQRKSAKCSTHNGDEKPPAAVLHQYQERDGHFSLVRNFRLADLVTIMNGFCGSFSVFSSARYLLTNDESYLWMAHVFPLAGLMFDFLDGKVARWRKSSSMLGQELDSLADLISFGVAPAVLAFAVGLRTTLDTVVLTGFICCGLARLARFNATVALVPKDAAGKAQYFEGLPIPSSLGLVSILAWWTKKGWIEGKQGVPWGTTTLWGSESGTGEIHFASFVFGLLAAAMCIDAVKGELRLSPTRTPPQPAFFASLATDDSLNISNVWDDFIVSVNNSINPLDLELAHLHDEVTGRQMYALVNRKDDEVAQIATEYTPIEIAYFKMIVEQIMLAPNESYSVSSFAALRESTNLRPSITKTQAENVLTSFVAKGWLLKSQRGRYSLSIRSLLELLPYLRNTYTDEVIECTICMEILTRGTACYTPNCKTRMHKHCFENYRKTHQKCPACSQDWSSEANKKKLIPVGEKAARADDGARKMRRKRSESEGNEDGDSQRRSQTSDDNQEMEVDEAETTQDTPPPQTNGRSRRSRRTQSTSQADESMDVDTEDSPQPARRSRRRN
ncbi:hypothetical protein EW146_g5971 [Bondarzewia mesenterica]|uniref:CDP-diacylglycerol--serine O-phosphatidyltransferase n=1 Tax=Bondarzewia mesenterica TaxID=1095465 RepID=A0A4S4LPZ1_9AGAM|nr:hypothetical protein EW146_g5971 [Bondarzewia mesenterica]